MLRSLEQIFNTLFPTVDGALVLIFFSRAAFPIDSKRHFRTHPSWYGYARLRDSKVMLAE